MEHKKFAVVIIAAVLASLMLAGTILAPIQSYASRQREGRKQIFQTPRVLNMQYSDGVSANLSHRDQHMNQQNLCYRANTCRQSDVGQNTLGNDNQVTGFADQSDNIQQAAPTNQTN